MYYTLKTHNSSYKVITKNVNKIYKAWKSIYTHDKSAGIYNALDIVIYPKNIYSLKIDQERANRERQYFNRQLTI